MRDLVILFVHLIVTVARLARPGGLRSVVAESALVRYQLLVLNRGRKRAPNLRAADRIIAGLCTLFMRPARVLRSAIVLKLSTLLHLHSVLTKRKYRLLFSPERRHRPGPKGPKKELIDAVVAMKRRNPGWAVPALLSRSPWLSPSRSTKMLFAASCAFTTDRNHIPEGLPGLRLLARQRTVYGVAIYSVANRQRSGHIGSSL
jgi:hypothetical protein